MSSLCKFCLLAAATLAVVAGSASKLAAHQREQPKEPPRELWPFFGVRAPLPLVAQTAESVETPTAEKKRKRPLVAPFVVPKVNINTCSLAQLQSLPGVSASMGALILAGRPYRDFDELRRQGVPLNVVNRLRGVVNFGERP